MKRIFRRNQIIITTLAVMIAAAGYLNYSSKKEVAGAEVYEAGMMDISDSDILAENQAKNGVDDGKLKEIASLDGDGEELLPDGNEVAAMPESAESAGAEVSGQETAAAGIENPGEAVLTGGTGISEYIAGVQLGREQIRAKNKETLMQIINSDQISEEEKQTAIQNLIGMTEISEKENAAETLLKAKGFVDPVVSITEDQVDVVVNAVTLTDPERAQIEDIVKRKTGIAAENIVITPLKEGEDVAEDSVDTAADVGESSDTSDGSSDDTFYEDSETSAQPYEDATIDTTDIYD